MQRVEFYGLERPIQERFVAAARGTAPPLPLAVKRELLPRSAGMCLALGALCLVGIGVFARVGYAKLDSPLALQSSSALGVYLVLGVAAGVLFAIAWRIQRERSRWPFSPGVYAFPSAVVDARSLSMRVHSMADLADASAAGASLSLAFSDGASFRFRASDSSRAADLARSVNELRQRFGPDVAPVSARELAVWDPLADNGFANPFSPRERMKQPKASLSWVALPVAALAFALAAVGVWALRNHLGEKALYAAARKADSHAAYEAYLARGGSNPDVSKLLLPRAELREVVAKNSIEELERFVKAHAGSAIDAEAENELLKQLLAALEEAKRAGTLKALKQFRSRFAGHPHIQGEITRAINARTEAGLARFAERAHPKPEVLEAFRRLLAYAAEHEGVVEVRCKRRLPESVAKTEELLAKAHWFGGKASLPGQYFDAKHAALREQPIQKQFVDTFSQGFDEDLLKFQPGAPIDDNTDEDPKVTVPSIIVIHRTEMSGAYLMKRPRAALTGVGVLFRIGVLIPGQGAVHNYRYSAWNSPDMKSMMDGHTFEQIYNEMADKAFTKLAKKYVNDVVPGLAPKTL
jgi:hypothetical protein